MIRDTLLSSPHLLLNRTKVYLLPFLTALWWQGRDEGFVPAWYISLKMRSSPCKHPPHALHALWLFLGLSFKWGGWKIKDFDSAGLKIFLSGLILLSFYISSVNMHKYELVLKFPHINKGIERIEHKQTLPPRTNHHYCGRPFTVTPSHFQCFGKSPCRLDYTLQITGKNELHLAFLPKKSSIFHSQAAIKHAANHSNLVDAGLDRASPDIITMQRLSAIWRQFKVNWS